MPAVKLAASVLALAVSLCLKMASVCGEDATRPETMAVDLGPSGDLRISGACVTQDQFSRILDRRMPPVELLELRVANDVDMAGLLSLLELSRSKGIAEVRTFFTGRSIEELTKSFKMDSAIVY